MKKNVIYAATLIIVVVGVMYLSYMIVATTKENRILARDNHNLETMSHLLKGSLVDGIRNTNVKIKPVVITDDETVSFNDIIKEKTVVLVFSEIACSPCLHREFKNIKQLESKGIPVMLITNSNNSRNLSVLQNEYDLTSPSLIVSDGESIHFNTGQLSTLYYFVLNENCDISHLFFPVQYNDRLSDTYLNILDVEFVNME